jgi:hypothetical protein
MASATSGTQSFEPPFPFPPVGGSRGGGAGAPHGANCRRLPRQEGCRPLKQSRAPSKYWIEPPNGVR